MILLGTGPPSTGVTAATTVQADIAALGAHSFLQVTPTPGTGMTSAPPARFYPGSNHAGHSMVLFGGVGVYAIEEFDPATLAFTRLDGRQGPGLSPNGRPWTQPVAGNAAYDPARNRLTILLADEVMAWDFTAHTWIHLAPRDGRPGHLPPASFAHTNLLHDPNLSALIAMGSSWGSAGEAANYVSHDGGVTFTPLSSRVPPGTADAVSVRSSRYISPLRKHLITHDDRWYLYDAITDSFSAALPLPGGIDSFDYDSLNGTVLLLQHHADPRTRAYLFRAWAWNVLTDPAAQAIRSLPVPPVAPRIRAGHNAAGNTLVYDAARNVFWFFVGPSTSGPELWAYRYAGAAPVKPLPAPLSISSISVSGIGERAATVRWTTTRPARGRVEYGVTASYGQTAAAPAVGATSFSVQLANLQPGALYNYRILVDDLAGATIRTSNHTFGTPGAAAPPPAGSDTAAPAVSLTAPAAGTIVSGTVTVSASASDSVGVTRIEFYVDGVRKATDTAAPYSFAWDTTDGGAHACRGTHIHSLLARAYDAASNVGTSASVVVNMNDPPSCSATPPSQAPRPPASAGSGLIGHWPFDEGSGTSARDASGNNRTATLVNAPSWTAGRVGSALGFDGANQYLTVPAFPATGFPFTVTGWMRTTRSAAFQAIVTQDSPAGNEGWAAGINQDNHLEIWYPGRPRNGAFRTMKVEPNVWYYFGFAVAEGRNEAQTWLYNASTGTFVYDYHTNLPSPLGAPASLTIGARSGGGSPFSGQLDEVRVYSRFLIDDEVAGLAGAGPSSFLDAKYMERAPVNRWTKLWFGPQIVGPTPVRHNTAYGKLPDGRIITQPYSLNTTGSLTLCSENLWEPLVKISTPLARGFAPTPYGNGQVWYWGGGHGGYRSNRNDIFEISTGRWRESSYIPSMGCTIAGATASNYGTPPGDGVTADPAGERVKPNGSAGNMPFWEHTTNRFAWDPRARRWMWAGKGSHWFYDPVTEYWTPFKFGSGGGNSGSPVTDAGAGFDYVSDTLSFDPDMNAMLYWSVNSHILRLNYGSGAPDFNGASWTKIHTFATDLPANGRQTKAVYDSTRQRHYYLVASATNLTVLQNPRLFWFDPRGGANPCTTATTVPCGESGEFRLPSELNGGVQKWAPGRAGTPNEHQAEPDCYNFICPYVFGSMAYDPVRDEVYLLTRRGVLNCGTAPNCTGYTGNPSPTDGDALLWGFKPGARTWRQITNVTAQTRLRLCTGLTPNGCEPGKTPESIQSNTWNMLQYIPEKDVLVLFLRSGGNGGPGGASTFCQIPQADGVLRLDSCFRAFALKTPGGTGTLPPAPAPLPGRPAAPAATPPVISSVHVSSVTASGATISWTTSKVSDTQIEYGLTPAYGSQSALDSAPVISHTQTLSGLAASAVYHFRVRSRDAAGNPAVSPNLTFVTASTTAPSPSPAPAKFKVGDRVRVAENLNTRSTPSTSGALLGTQLVGALGTVTGSPTADNGFIWWNINYDTGPDGWSVEDFLEPSTVAMPAPGPAPAPTPAPAPAPITGAFCSDLTKRYGSGIVRCVDFRNVKDAAINSTTDSGVAAVGTHLYNPRITATPDATGSLHWKIKSYEQVRREEPTLSKGQAWYKALRSDKGVWQRWIGQNYKPGVTYYFQFKYRFNNAAKMRWGGGGYKVFGMSAGCRQDPRDPTGRTWIPALCDATLNLPGQALKSDRVTDLGTADSRETNVMATQNWWPAAANAPHRPYPVMYQGSSNFQFTHGYTPSASTPGLGTSQMEQPGPDANGPWDGSYVTKQCASLLRLRDPDYVKDGHCVTYGAPDVWHEITMAFRPGPTTYNFDRQAPASQKVWTHDTLLKVWYDGKLIVSFDPDQPPFRPDQISAAACAALPREHPRWDECRTGLTLLSDSRDLPQDCKTKLPAEGGRCGSSYPVAAAPWIPGDPGADPSQFNFWVFSYRRGKPTRDWCDHEIGAGDPRYKTCLGQTGSADAVADFAAFLNHGEVHYYYDDWVVSTVPLPMVNGHFSRSSVR